jgi:predicted metalloprotease with PDZ domain
MSKSLQFLAVLVFSATVILAKCQTTNAGDRVWPPSQQQAVFVPQLGFMSFFNGYGEQVVSVTPGSLAWEAGLEPHDVVVAVNGARLRYDGHWYALMQDAAYRGHVMLAIRDCRTGQIVRRHIDLGMDSGDFGGGSAITPKSVR